MTARAHAAPPSARPLLQQPTGRSSDLLVNLLSEPSRYTKA